MILFQIEKLYLLLEIQKAKKAEAPPTPPQKKPINKWREYYIFNT